MKRNLFREIINLDIIISDVFAKKRMLSKRRKRMLIPEEYFIEVITTVPARKAVVENYEN